LTTISNIAFYTNSKLNNLHIPASVTAINGNIVGNCSALTNLTVDGNNPNYTAIDGVIFNKNQTEIIAMPNTKTNYIIPQGVTTIKTGAFSYAYALTSITVPNSVSTIEDRAFAYCQGLTTITIPSSVNAMGSATFNSCSALKTINVQKPANSITGAPWGAPYGILAVKWNQ